MSEAIPRYEQAIGTAEGRTDAYYTSKSTSNLPHSLGGSDNSIVAVTLALQAEHEYLNRHNVSNTKVQNQQEPHSGGVENLLLVKMPVMKFPINPLTLRPTVSCNVPYLSVAINTQIPIPIPHLHSLPKPYTNHLSQMNTIQTKGSRQVLPAKESPNRRPSH